VPTPQPAQTHPQISREHGPFPVSHLSLLWHRTQGGGNRKCVCLRRILPSAMIKVKLGGLLSPVPLSVLRHLHSKSRREQMKGAESHEREIEYTDKQKMAERRWMRSCCVCKLFISPTPFLILSSLLSVNLAASLWPPPAVPIKPDV